MSFYNVVKEAEVIAATPAYLKNEVLQVLEYLEKESGWLRVSRLTDVWMISAREVDNTCQKWIDREIGFVLLRSGQVFIGGERVNPYMRHHDDFSSHALGLLQVVNPDLYHAVLEALPPPTQW